MRHHWHSASDALSLFLLVNTPFLLVKTPVVTLKTIIPFSVSSAPKCAFKRETARDAPSGANDSPSFRIWFTEIVHWLHESTGAEIETALCILESVLPTLVSTRYYTRKLGSGNLWVPLAASCDPSAKRGPPWGPRKLGNSESGIWDSICLGPKRGPRKLGNSETGIWGSLGRGPKRGAPRKLGNSESGIWVYLQTGPKPAVT
jgi:hypothetical protein